MLLRFESVLYCRCVLVSPSSSSYSERKTRERTVFAMLTGRRRSVPAAGLIFAGAFVLEPKGSFMLLNAVVIVEENPSSVLAFACACCGAPWSWLWSCECACECPCPARRAVFSPGSIYRCSPSWLTNQLTMYCLPSGPPPQLPARAWLGGLFTANAKRFGGSEKSVTRPRWKRK